MKTRAGLNAGILCSGMMMVVFLEMLRAVFCERFLDNFHELLKGSEDGSLLDAGGFSDFVDDFGFSHC